MKKFFLLIFLFASLAGLAQTTIDSTVATKKAVPDTGKYVYPIPKRAALYSALLPGLGQAYNKSYWKIPLVYAGLGTVGYLLYTTNKSYQSLKQGYLTRVDGIGGNNTYTDTITWTTERLNLEQDSKHQRRDLLIIVGLLVYVANIVDATVDAHLYHFDVSDNLSMEVKPTIQYNCASQNFTSGFTLNFAWHTNRKKSPLATRSNSFYFTY